MSEDRKPIEELTLEEYKRMSGSERKHYTRQLLDIYTAQLNAGLNDVHPDQLTEEEFLATICFEPSRGQRNRLVDAIREAKSN